MDGSADAPWAEIAYEQMAPVYDQFTAHNNYELWLGALLPKAEAHGLGGRRLLDVACGTGKSFIPMLERGWEVTACDISAAMVELARAKVGRRARIEVADMRELPKFGEFDLILCLDDPVNYLLERDELDRALAGMRRNLAPRGLLMFDANTTRPYRTFFAEDIAVESNGRRLLWHGQANRDQPVGALSEARFEVERLPGEAEPPIPPVVHRQRHYPEAEILAALAEAGLECLDVWGHDDTTVPEQPLEESRHDKGIYISRRAGGAP